MIKYYLKLVEPETKCILRGADVTDLINFIMGNFNVSFVEVKGLINHLIEVVEEK